VEAARWRDARPVFFLDLAVPRDVDPGVSDLPGVSLADVDDLGPALSRELGPAVMAALDEARAIVRHEVERFAAWRRSARLAPLIQALRERGDQTVEAELARALPKLARLTATEREAVESLARLVVAKLLHEPIVRVKQLSGPGLGDSYARALAELFGLRLPDA